MTKMKRILWIVLSLAMTAPAVRLNAQALENLKERQALAKETRAALNTRASKDARKEAKRLQKEGWQVSPGMLPLEKQLDRVYQMLYQYDADLSPTYIIGDAQSIGETYDAAKFQAIELAKISLASQIESEMVGIIDTDVSNAQLSAEEAASVTKSVGAMKSVMAQKLGRVIPVVECYRTLPNKNKEVRVMIVYSTKQALEQAKKTVREQLADEGADLRAKLDQAFGF